jgi:beta-lactamase regulating signal transducer with metallopeptidase domain
VIGPYLAEVALKATLLIALAFAVVALVKGPANRHFLWKVCLLAVLALPVLSALPGRQLTLPTPTPKHHATTQPAATTTQDLNPAPANATTPETQAPTNPSTVPAIIAAIWAGGTLALLTRIAAGLAQLKSIKSEPAQGLQNPHAEVRIETEDNGLSPLTWGHFRPVILLPKESLQWPQSRLECVLHHEQAHVQRHDFLFKLLTEAACAIYWFNPLVWLAARSMNAEAEMAADALAAQAQPSPSDYATELLWLASNLTQRPLQLASGVPAMNKNKLEQRIQSILDPRTRTRGMTTFAGLAAVAIVAAITVGIATAHSYANRNLSQEETEKIADGRAKTLSVAMQMYSLDFDDDLLWAKDTDTAENALWPYVMDLKVFQSPTPGGRFIYNPKIGAVNYKSFKDPADAVLWYESLPDKNAPYYVATADGKDHLVTDENRDKYQAALRKNYKRLAGAIPLPNHAPPAGK